jgi:ankyrin repeat protein
MISLELNLKDFSNMNDFCIGNLTPLYIACQNGCLEIIKLLLKNGTDTNIRTNNKHRDINNQNKTASEIAKIK